MANILDEIVAHKRIEIEASMKLVSLSQLQEDCRTTEARPDFLDAIRLSAGVALIAEVKKASPVEGVDTRRL